jgi:hypothetical protein
VRCGGLGQADARLITIGELDAGCLERAADHVEGHVVLGALTFSTFLATAYEGGRRGHHRSRR